MDLSKSNKLGTQFSKVELVHEDSLDGGIVIKYLCFTTNIERPRLTIEPIDSAHITIKLQHTDQTLR